MNIINYFFEKIIISAAERLMHRYRKNSQQMAVITDDFVSLKAMLQGRFEDTQISILEKDVFPKLHSRKYCLDIGANIGNHSVAFSRSFQNVYSFEPNPKTFDVLKLNAKWNPQIHPFNLGASDKKYTAIAKVPAGNLGAAEIINNESTLISNTIEFDCIRLDDFLDKEISENVSFIKIDVEGHEYEALSGCRGIIGLSQPVIAFELLKKDYDRSSKKILGLLQENNYSFFYEIDKTIRQIYEFKKKNHKMIIASTKAIL